MTWERPQQGPSRERETRDPHHDYHKVLHMQTVKCWASEESAFFLWLLPEGALPGRTPRAHHTPERRRGARRGWGWGDTHLVRKVGLDLVVQLPVEGGEKGPVRGQQGACGDGR